MEIRGREFQVEDGIIKDLGKFENEPVYVAFLYLAPWQPKREFSFSVYQVDWVGMYIVNSEIANKFDSLEVEDKIFIHENNTGFVSELDISEDQFNEMIQDHEPEPLL